MALIKSRVRPSSASESNLRTKWHAGCLPPIHSRMAHESRTRVFTLALPFLEGGECADQIATCPGSLQFFPGSLWGKHDLPATDFKREFGTFREIQLVTDGFWNCDLALRGHRNLFHMLILP